MSLHHDTTSYERATAVTPHDTNDNSYSRLYVGGGGDVAVTTAGGDVVTFKAVPVGTVLPIRTLKVMATNTNASLILGAALMIRRLLPLTLALLPFAAAAAPASQHATISSGSIDNTSIGATTPAVGDFTTLHANSADFTAAPTVQGAAWVPDEVLPGVDLTNHPPSYFRALGAGHHMLRTQRTTVSFPGSNTYVDLKVTVADATANSQPIVEEASDGENDWKRKSVTGNDAAWRSTGSNNGWFKILDSDGNKPDLAASDVLNAGALAQKSTIASADISSGAVTSSALATGAVDLSTTKVTGKSLANVDSAAATKLATVATGATACTTYRQTSAPTGGTYAACDRWIDTSATPRVHYGWSGSAWEEVGAGGALAAKNMVTASYQATTFGENLIGDPDFNDVNDITSGTSAYWKASWAQGGGNYLSANWAVDAATSDLNPLAAVQGVRFVGSVPGTGNVYTGKVTGQKIRVIPGVSYEASIAVYPFSGFVGGGVTIGMTYYKSDGTQITATNFSGGIVTAGVASTVNWTLTPPALTAYMTMSAQLQFGGATFGASTGDFVLANPRIARLITYGELTGTAAANTVLSGPSSGGAVAPTFRLLTASDVPSVNCSALPAHTGDVTSGIGSCANVLASSGVAAGTYGDSSHSPVVTFDAKGRATAASTTAITPASIGAQALTGKDVASGYAGLDTSTLLKCAEMPALTGDVTSAGCATTLNKLIQLPRYTWSAIPAASSNANLIVQITDVGIGGSLWVSDGSVWHPVGSVTLCRSAVAASASSTTTETTLATCAVPAGAMALNHHLAIDMEMSFTGSTNQKTMRAKLGGTTFVQNLTTTAANISYRGGGTITNRGAANSQIAPPVALNGAGGFGNVAAVTGTVDTTVAQNVTFTALMASAAETMTLESYEVRLLP